MRLPLIKGAKVGIESEWRDSLPLNMTGFVQDVDGDTYYMRTLDGLTSYATGLGEDRGAIWSDAFKIHVRLSGEYLVEVDEFGNVTDVGDGVTIPGTGQAQFANSFNTIGIVAGGEFYLYDPDWTDDITDHDQLQLIDKPTGALDYTDITYIDGYYLLSDGEVIYSTTISDEYTISSIDYAGSDYQPDQIVGLGKATDGKLLAFNRYNTERFYNSAGDQFPFSRINNAAIPIGIVGPRAKVSIGDGSWVVLGGSKEYSPTFYLVTSGYAKISTGAIDNILDSYADYELQTASIEFRDVRDQRLVICHLARDVLVYDVTLSAALEVPIWYKWETDGGVWRGINGIYDPRSVGDSSSSWIYGDKDDKDL